MEGKCPKDGRSQRPVFITINNKRKMVIADGKGDCFLIESEEPYVFETRLIEENKVNPQDYEFERGITGFDF